MCHLLPFLISLRPGTIIGPSYVGQSHWLSIGSKQTFHVCVRIFILYNGLMNKFSSNFISRQTVIKWEHGIPVNWGFWHSHLQLLLFFIRTLSLKSLRVYSSLGWSRLAGSLFYSNLNLKSCHWPFASPHGTRRCGVGHPCKSLTTTEKEMIANSPCWNFWILYCKHLYTSVNKAVSQHQSVFTK